MTTLVLVRHGQASFGAPDYDRLSTLGEQQGTLLGEHWQRCGLRPDAAFSGTMQRQRVTGERMLAALGTPADTLALHAGFNEYDHVGLIRGYLPVVLRAHPELAGKTDLAAGDAQQFRTLFNEVIDAWMAGTPAEGPIAETWDAFRARVADGLAHVATAGERVVVFTSGGVIAAALQRALGVEDRVARALNWRIFNASVHSFHVGRNGLDLLGFNDVAHLQAMQDPRLLTRL